MTTLYDYLIQLGYNESRADIWNEFISAIFEALVVAEAALKDTTQWDEYSNGTHGAFGKPHKRGIHKGRCLPSEEGISGELTRFMNDFLIKTPSDHVLRKWHVNFHNEAPVYSRKRKGKHRHLTDIRATSYKVGGPEFVFEAKIVDTEGHIRSRLLGSSGLGCFTSVEPYTQADIGGLIAYTVRDDEKTWLSRVDSSYLSLSAAVGKTCHIHIGPCGFNAIGVPVNRSTKSDPITMINIVLRFDTKAA